MTSQLIVLDNKKCQFISDDPALCKKLHKFLSYKQAGYEYTPAFRNSGWNGITYLMNKSGIFSSGLHSKVREFLLKEVLVLEEDDRRKLPVINQGIDLWAKLKILNMAPRYYQDDIVNICLNNRKGIVRACTGSGKSLTTALLAAKLNKPTIIYVIGLDLLQQFYDLYSSLFDEKIGFIGNGTCDIHRINIASIWTISSALKVKGPVSLEEDEKEIAPDQTQSEKIIDMLEKTKLHIFDESHVVTTETIKQIYNKIDPEYIYGFSGTPFRDDGSDLLINSILGDQIIDVPASQLIADGYLAQPIIKFIKTPKTYIGTGTSSYQTVYKEYITENIIRNKLIVENTKELLDKKYQVLVLFKHLQHGKNLKELFDLENINYEYLSGVDSLDDRNIVKENLLSHKSNLILASTIYDIGVDISSLSALVLTGSGKSSVKSLQRVGRCLRIYPGKKHAAIVDFYDDVKYLKTHSKIRHKIYKSEDGFKLIVPKSIKDLK